MPGRLIAFEGGEGAGKSTQIAILSERLAARGEDVVVTREPGGTPGAEEIRALFVHGGQARWTPETDALLVTAARADHVARLIRPALQAGKTVLCDRFVHSTLAYQGHAGGLDPDALLALHRFATGDLWPDLVLWLDLPVELGLQRSRARGGASGAATEQRFEGFALDYHARVRAGFTALAKADPRIRRIDAARSAELVAQDIAAVVLA